MSKLNRRDIIKALPALAAATAAVPAMASAPSLEPLEFAADRFDIWEQAKRVTPDDRLRSAASYLRHCMEKAADGDRYIVCVNGDEAAFALIFGDGAQIKRRIDFI